MKRKSVEFEENPSPENIAGRRKLSAKRSNLRTYNDSVPTPNIMNMSKEQRQEYFRTNDNPFGWPLEYLEIYKRERLMTDPKGFDHLLCIDNISLFKKGPDQSAKQTRIQNFMNVNCVKSRHTDYINLENIIFGPEIIDMLQRNGIQYVGEFEEFVDAQCETNEVYKSKKMDIEAQLFYEMGEAMGGSLNDQEKNDWKSSEGLYEDERFADLKRDFRGHLIPIYNELVKNQPNKYRIIIEIIKMKLGELAQFVCIAGGFALSMYVFEKYGYSLGFSDIDLFIHSCDERTANMIINRLGDITGNKILKNDNVILSWINNLASSDYYKEYHDLDFSDEKHLINIDFDETAMSIQIIKRLYTCPSQIILGFDVDSCCILTTLDGNVFVTERGAYAIRNAYNVVNFDRLSPSYEYRLTKYNKRGFGIWIPFVDYFKVNSVFDVDVMDKHKQSSIILRDLIYVRRPKNIEKPTETNTVFILSDYALGPKYDSYDGSYVNFKMLNPGEQIIGTFHRIVLDDIKEWYPLRPENTLDFVPINHLKNKRCEINEPLVMPKVSAMNIVRRTGSLKRSELAFEASRNMIHYIEHILPNSIITGDIPKCAISGLGNRDDESFLRKLGFKLYNPILQTELEKQFFRYHIIKYKMLSFVKNAFRESIDFKSITDNNLLGSVIFKDNNGKFAENEQQNFENYCSIMTGYGGIFYAMIFCAIDKLHPYYGAQKNAVFVPSKLFEEMFTIFIKSEDVRQKIEMAKLYYKKSFQIENFINMFYDRDVNDEIIDETDRIIKFKDINALESLIYSKRNLRSLKHRLMNGDNGSELYTDIKRILLNKQLNIIFEENYERARLYFVLLTYNINQIDSSINIEISNILDDNFVEEVTYHSGKYFSTEYNANLLNLGIDEKNIGSKIIVYDEPAYQQYFP
jgi:hypothetical protein